MRLGWLSLWAPAAWRRPRRRVRSHWLARRVDALEPRLVMFVGIEIGLSGTPLGIPLDASVSLGSSEDSAAQSDATPDPVLSLTVPLGSLLPILGPSDGEASLVAAPGQPAPAGSSDGLNVSLSLGDGSEPVNPRQNLLQNGNPTGGSRRSSSSTTSSSTTFSSTTSSSTTSTAGTSRTRTISSLIALGTSRNAEFDLSAGVAGRTFGGSSGGSRLTGGRLGPSLAFALRRGGAGSDVSGDPEPAFPLDEESTASRKSDEPLEVRKRKSRVIDPRAPQVLNTIDPLGENRGDAAQSDEADPPAENQAWLGWGVIDPVVLMLATAGFVAGAIQLSRQPWAGRIVDSLFQSSKSLGRILFGK